MQIQKFKDLTKEAFKEIGKYQNGEKGVIKTGLPYFDDLFPVVNGSVIVYSAGSGVGKSHQLAKMTDNILNEELNPTSKNFAVLHISLEMRVISLILRGLSKNIKSKTKKQILLEQLTEEEKKAANDYFISLQDDRVSISQVPTTPQKFFEGCRDFLEKNKDKDSVIITVDHLALVQGDKGEPKNTVIEHFIEKTIDLKMTYENVIFIFLSQTNSEMAKRAQDKSIMSQPTASDIYYSQFTFQVADYVAIMISPAKLGIKEYSKIDPERYSNLSKYFLEEDKNGRVSLETYGVNYVHLLKCREAEGLYLDIYPEEMFVPNADKVREENKKPKMYIGVPIFNKVEFAEKKLEDICPPPSFQELGSIFDAPKKELENPPF